MWNSDCKEELSWDWTVGSSVRDTNHWIDIVHSHKCIFSFSFPFIFFFLLPEVVCTH